MGDIDVAFVQQFNSVVTHLSQQKQSRLMQTVKVQQTQGKYGYFNLIGKTESVKKKARNSLTPQIDVPVYRRRYILETEEWGTTIDDADEVRLLIDPRSEFTRAAAMAMGRAIDDYIIDAALGNARSIDNVDASTNIAFDSAMIIDEDFGAANSDLTFKKLNEARRLLLTREVDPDDDLIIVADATAIHSFLTESEAQSFDTNNMKPLVEGKIVRFMGFNFVHSESVPKNSEGFAQVLFYTRSAIGLGVGRAPVARMGPNAERSFNTTIYYAMDLGAVRIEESKIGIIQCYRA